MREKGWKADINIGTGKFRIDVAVHHPEKTDEYCLGIMFDDDASALQDTVRDRNLLQKNVLQRMGWNILNLWLLDWYEDSETQIQRIEDTLKEYDRIMTGGKDGTVGFVLPGADDQSECTFLRTPPLPVIM